MSCAVLTLVASAGIAEFYSAVLLYRLGLRDKKYFVKTINSHIQGYFTSPLINVDVRDAARDLFNSWYAVWIAYKRGCAYLTIVDSNLRRAAGDFDLLDKSLLDEVVIDLATRKRNGEKVQGKDWLQLLSRHSGGASFEKHLPAMLFGESLDFSGVFCGSPTLQFARRDVRTLQFGFGRNSLRTRVLYDVEPGSPAYRAGLRDGEEIVAASSHNRCTGEESATYKLRIRRDGCEDTIEYLPRSEELIISWELCP